MRMIETDHEGHRIYRDTNGQIIERALTDEEICAMLQRRAAAWDKLYAEMKAHREPQWRQASFDQGDPEAMNARMLFDA